MAALSQRRRMNRRKVASVKFGLRIPSLTKRIAARLSWKRYVRHSLGLKAPRGWGWLTNPKKALYNRIYKRTSIGCSVVVVIVGGVLVLRATLWTVRRVQSPPTSSLRLRDESGVRGSHRELLLRCRRRAGELRSSPHVVLHRLNSGALGTPRQGLRDGVLLTGRTPHPL